MKQLTLTLVLVLAVFFITVGNQAEAYKVPEYDDCDVDLYIEFEGYGGTGSVTDVSDIVVAWVDVTLHVADHLWNPYGHVILTVNGEVVLDEYSHVVGTHVFPVKVTNGVVDGEWELWSHGQTTFAGDHPYAGVSVSELICCEPPAGCSENSGD